MIIRPASSGGVHWFVYTTASNVVRIIGVLLTPDLSLDKHFKAVSTKCFSQLCQQCRIWRCLNDAHVNIHVHAFVTSHVDYCGSLVFGVPKKTNKLQHVLSAVLCIISNTRKYDQGLGHFQRNILHWSDNVERVWSRLCVQIYRCLHSMAPGYLSALCRLISSVPGCWHLRSAESGQLDFLRFRLAIYGGRSFNLEFATFLRSGQFTDLSVNVILNIHFLILLAHITRLRLLYVSVLYKLIVDLTWIVKKRISATSETGVNLKLTPLAKNSVANVRMTCKLHC